MGFLSLGPLGVCVCVTWPPTLPGKPAPSAAAARRSMPPARTARMTARWAACWPSRATPTWRPRWRAAMVPAYTSATVWSSPTQWCRARTPPSTPSPTTGPHRDWTRNWWERETDQTGALLFINVHDMHIPLQAFYSVYLSWGVNFLNDFFHFSVTYSFVFRFSTSRLKYFASKSLLEM